LDFPATKSVLTVTPLEYGKWPSLLPESFSASLRGLRDAIRGRKRMKQKYRDLMAKRKIDDAQLLSLMHASESQVHAWL
jgi:hypothetical protein